MTDRAQVYFLTIFCSYDAEQTPSSDLQPAAGCSVFTLSSGAAQVSLQAPTFALSSAEPKSPLITLGITGFCSTPAVGRYIFRGETENVIEVSAAGIFGLQRLEEQQVVPQPVMEVSFSGCRKARAAV